MFNFNKLLAFVLAVPFVVAAPGKRALPAICQKLEPVAADLLENLFGGECGDSAHGALRLIFHDAIGISPIVGGGGADGSIVTFNATELTFEANDGLDDVIADVGPFFLKHQDQITSGDFVQLAGALSLAACPGAPRVQFFAGREPPKAASPNFLVPEPFNTTDQIIERFAQVGFAPDEIVALLSSHSIAGADTVDPTIPGTPFDTTPSVYDTNIFIDVLLKGTLFPGTAGNQGELMTAVNGTLRLQSDFEIAHDPRTACTWQEFATNQPLMASKFGPAVLKLSFLGQDPAKLTDCSELIPQPPALKDVPEFPPGQFLSDIQASCDVARFPDLPTQPGPPLDVAPIPQADSDDES
ncbi:fungal versatile peroxidase from pleurotus Eryngii [Pluteus cervinus]|uniref:Fungal versatile peroxidase from pleurotus Eryngii n=1 Tax=Pluteus cervinus TaxID=181527 RepID=A0ACD3AAY6_9AGAR|nr:fungal versatile peroxidase from pleurotus Eryngii [Pluteus cervinus]